MNEQIAQALAQLRDIHEPASPPFWPLPLGWWFLALCVIAMIACLIWWWHRRNKIDRPYREIRETSSQLRDLYHQDQLSEYEFISAINRLYKHLLIDVESVPGAVQADGLPWLNMLADRFGDDAFIAGAGKCLGTVRYRPMSFFDTRLDELMARTLCVVRSPSRKALTA